MADSQCHCGWPVAGVFDVDGGNASVPGTFAFDSPSTVPGLGTYTAAVTFTPTDTAHYGSVSGTVNVTVEQAYWYVKSGSSGDGTSWASPLGSIQDAVDAASDVDGGEIWVAAGRYTATTTNVVTMAMNVHLYGGFAGTETARDKRDWEANKTIIDGESERLCVLGADKATLDGFVIQSGFVQGDASRRAYGAGMVNYGNSVPFEQTYSLTVGHCTLIQNTASDYCSGGGCAITLLPLP